MARVPDEEIERLKKDVDLTELVIRSGVALRKAGGDLVGCCPFHDDGSPSLVVTPSKNLWHCMGACQVGGSAIDWVMRTQGVSFRHAVEVLREGMAPVITPGRGAPVAKRSVSRRLPSPLDISAEDQAVLSQVLDYYHATLLESPEALRYLARRKIDDPEVIARFRLGYANRTLGYRLPSKQTKEGGAVRTRLIALGVLRASGHEHLSGSVVVPVITPKGVVTELYGRKLRNNLRVGTPSHLYLPGPHQGVWNEEALAGGEVILCESLIDALTFYCAGFPHVTASYGTAGFSADHAEALARQRVTRVLIAYDHDAAGDEGAKKLATELMAGGIECFRILFPYGSDANDVATGAAKPADALGRAVRAAEWMGAGRLTRRQAAPAGPGDVDADQGDSEQDDSEHGVGAATDGTDHGGSEQCDNADTEVAEHGDTVQPLFSSAAVFAVAAPLATPAAHDELILDMGPRRWRVRHIPKNPSPGSLRVNVMVSLGERFHVDTVDLYSAKARTGFVEAGAAELRCEHDTLKAELGQVLLATEDTQAAVAVPEASGVPPMSAADREDALALLSAPDLIDQVAAAFTTLGVVGERTSALTAWLTLTSRLSDRPLGAVIQSSSSAGKSTLADAALALMPQESTVTYSAMTGQALYYLGESDLAHKVLSIAEEEGASRASYALKLLVSEGRLSIAAAGKDPITGRLVTNTYEVTGPVALLMTTTSPELDEELANRLLVLAVDEGRHQTRAVHVAQRDAETLEGLVARSKRAEVIVRHANAQRLLSPVAVVNPHAPGLGFSDRSTRHRRDNAKYLGLIRAVTLAHQHQRARNQVCVEGKTVTYIEATTSDVALAETLCAHVLGTTTDELSPATRNLLSAIVEFCAKGGSRFTRRALRDATGLGDSQLKVHLSRLVDLEYVATERAGPATTYELVADVDHGANHVYGSDRPGQRSYRPGENSDRPVIGRFGSHKKRTQNPQLDGTVDPPGDQSGGIGRAGAESDKARSARENQPPEPDRPGLRQIHGTGAGDDEGVVVDRARVGGS
ncbi:MAG: CHC2 zinc finger domain-containing protein [Acidimicrobiales bacterium]